MNILFVNSINDIKSPQKPLSTPEQMQFGISYISSVLKKEQHSTMLVVLSRLLGKQNKKMIDDAFDKFKPAAVVFTAVSTEYSFICKTAKYIKHKYPETYLIIGGPHVSLNPEGVLEGPFDALCIGEGEYPMLELIGQVEKGAIPSGIRNLWIKRGQKIEKNPPRPFIQDLDTLPFPDRDMWNGWIGDAGASRQPVLLGRGCPFECSYCCNHALKKIAEGRYVRFRSPDNILSEIKEIAMRYPYKREIYLEVETIGADEVWAMELCSKLEAFNRTLDKPLTFGVNLRIAPNVDFEKLFAAFKKSGFTDVNIGVESGSERVRREILNRHYSNKDIIHVVDLAKRFGLRVHFYNLIGVPGETPADFKETIAINRACQPDTTYTHIFFPYPGTKLYSICREQGLLNENADTGLERCKATLDLPGFSKREIQKAFTWFDYNVYKRYRPVGKILAKVILSKIRSNSSAHAIYRKITYTLPYRYLKSLLQ